MKANRGKNSRKWEQQHKKGFATMHSTSIALIGGSRLVKCVHLITASGSFRSTVTRIYSWYNNEQEEFQKLAMHEESSTRRKVDDDVHEGAVPAYLMDRESTTRAKILSNTIKQKRKEKAGKWEVPLPKVRPVAEDEMFRVIRSGKRKTKQWKRMVTKATFVGAGFTRKPPKYERFIRPSGLRFTKAHVTHPELKCTFNLEIIRVKKNPNGPMYTSLGVITKGTIIEVNVSELGLVTPAGKVVWGKYAQVTNNPENDGCVNGVVLVCVVFCNREKTAPILF